MRRALIVVALTILVCSAGPATPTATAASWARAVAEFVCDPNFYRELPEAEFRRSRYLPLVPNPEFDSDGGSVRGNNRAAGILYMSSNLWGRRAKGYLRIDQILLVLPVRGPDGAAVYPLLLAEMEKRLPKRTWSCTRTKKGRFWRKGKSRSVVDLHLTEFHSPDAQLVGIGDSVVVTAGMEDGDSEEP